MRPEDSEGSPGGSPDVSPDSFHDASPGSSHDPAYEGPHDSSPGFPHDSSPGFPHDSSPGASRSSKRVRRRFIAWCLALGLSSVVLWLLLGGPDRDLEWPVRLIRGADGTLSPATPEDAEAWREPRDVEIRLELTSAGSRFNSTLVRTGGSPAAFPSSRIAVFNLSEHPLAGGVARRIIEKLGSLSSVQEILYFPPGKGPEQGSAAPDIVVCLELESLGGWNLLLVRKIEARFRVTAGDRYADGHSGYDDPLAAPVVHFALDGTLERTELAKGIASPAARYAGLVESAGSEISEGLLKVFRKYLDEDGPMPELPASFHPPYREPPWLPFAASALRRPEATFHGLLTRGESYWRLPLHRPADQVLPEIEGQLLEDGWKISSKDPEKSHMHITAVKGPAVLHFFPPRLGGIYPPAAVGFAGAAPAPRRAEGGEEPLPGAPWPTFLHVRLIDRLSLDEIRAAVDDLLAGDSTIEAALLFESAWTVDQRRRVLESAGSRPPAGPRAWLALARLYRSEGQVDAAVAAVRRARSLLGTAQRPGGLAEEAGKLERELTGGGGGPSGR